MRRLDPITPEPRPSDMVIMVLLACMIVFFVFMVVYGLNGMAEHFYNVGVV